MLLVRRTAAKEVLASSASGSHRWITAERGTDIWTLVGYIAVVIMICCCKLVGLLAAWRKSRWVCASDQPCHAGSGWRSRTKITRGDAVQCRHDCQFFLKPHSIQTQSWCSHLDPTDGQTKRGLEAAHRDMRTSGCSQREAVHK